MQNARAALSIRRIQEKCVAATIKRAATSGAYCANSPCVCGLAFPSVKLSLSKPMLPWPTVMITRNHSTTINRQ